MSATQDASDIAENLVALDMECRDQSIAATCDAFVVTEAFQATGRTCGEIPIYEGQRFKLAGVHVGEDAVTRVIIAIDEDDSDPDDPVKWHLDPTQLEESFPAISERVESLVPKVTEFRDLSDLRHHTHRTFAGKPALYGVLRQTLKAGRRSYLEQKAEQEEMSQADFYKRQEDFGSF